MGSALGLAFAAGGGGSGAGVVMTMGSSVFFFISPGVDSVGGAEINALI